MTDAEPGADQPEMRRASDTAIAAGLVHSTPDHTVALAVIAAVVAIAGIVGTTVLAITGH